MKSFTYGAFAAGVVAFAALHPWTLFAAPVRPAVAAAAPSGDSCDPKAHERVDAAVHAIPEDGSPALGPQTAPVTIVEFTDYECPYCLRADQTLAQLRQKYGSRIRWVVKQMPLPMHHRAQK